MICHCVSLNWLLCLCCGWLQQYFSPHDVEHVLCFPPAVPVAGLKPYIFMWCNLDLDRGATPYKFWCFFICVHAAYVCGGLNHHQWESSEYHTCTWGAQQDVSLIFFSSSLILADQNTHNDKNNSHFDFIGSFPSTYKDQFHLMTSIPFCGWMFVTSSNWTGMNM